MPTSLSSTTSSAKSCCSAGSVIALPPYLMTMVLPWNFLMYGSACARISALSRGATCERSCVAGRAAAGVAVMASSPRRAKGSGDRILHFAGTRQMSPAIEERSRSTPVFGDYEVVALGGSPAGIAAAASAALHGARTLLIERYGFLTSFSARQGARLRGCLCALHRAAARHPRDAASSAKPCS